MPDSEESLVSLYNYWLRQREYAKKSRATQKRMAKREPERLEYWRDRQGQWHVRYKECADKCRAIRKLLRKLAK
jgi:hypothetical protein